MNRPLIRRVTQHKENIIFEKKGKEVIFCLCTAAGVVLDWTGQRVYVILGDSWNYTRTFIMYVSTCTFSDVTAINVRALICTWNVTCTLNIIKCRYLHSTTEIFQRPPTAVLLWFLIPFRMEYNFFTDHLIERRKETNLWWVVSHVPSTTVHTSSTEKATYSRSLRVRY